MCVCVCLPEGMKVLRCPQAGAEAWSLKAGAGQRRRRADRAVARPAGPTLQVAAEVLNIFLGNLIVLRAKATSGEQIG